MGTETTLQRLKNAVFYFKFWKRAIFFYFARGLAHLYLLQPLKIKFRLPPLTKVLVAPLLVTPLRTIVATFLERGGGRQPHGLQTSKKKTMSCAVHFYAFKFQQRSRRKWSDIFERSTIICVKCVNGITTQHGCFASTKCVGNPSCCRTCMPVTISWLGMSWPSAIFLTTWWREELDGETCLDHYIGMSWGGGLIVVNNQPCCMLCPRFDCICELCSIDSGIMFEQDERDREKAKMLIGIYWFFWCMAMF